MYRMNFLRTNRKNQKKIKTKVGRRKRREDTKEVEGEK